MRLYSTLARELVDLPEPPGPVRMYVCGPTVYARAHVGNARPFVLGDVAARVAARARLRRRCSSTTSPTSTTRSTRRRPGASAELAGARDRVVPRGHGRLRPRHARPPAAGDRLDPGDRRVHRASSSTRGFAYAVDGDVYFRVARDPGLRAALGSAARPGRGAGAERAQGGPARLRALEGEQGRRGHLRGTRRGGAAGPAGTSSARRWPRSCSGRRSRSTAAGSTSSSRTTRTSSRSRSRSATSSRKIWMHNGMLRFVGEKMSKSLGNVADDPRGAGRVGQGDAAALLPDRRTGASRSTSPRRRWRRRRRRSRRSATRSSASRGRRRKASGSGSRRCSTTTSTRRTRSRSSTSGAPRATSTCCGAGSRSSGSARSRSRSEAPPEAARARTRGGSRRARRSEFAEADRLRDELDAAGWDVRDEPAAAIGSCGRR